MTDPLQVKRLLKKEVVDFLVKLGGQVDYKAIRKARKHLLQKYNTDHKRNTEATDSYFGIVHEWVRERLIESSVKEYITAVADHAEEHAQEAFLLRGNPHVEAALRELQDKQKRGRVKGRGNDTGFKTAKKRVKRVSNDLNKTQAPRPVKRKSLSDNEEQSAKFVDKMELFFATHCPTKDCSRRYALLFRKMLQRRHNGYNLMFPIDDDFVDNLFHFIETLQGNKYRSVDNGFSHSCLTKIRSIGKKAFTVCWNEVRLLINDDM